MQPLLSIRLQYQPFIYIFYSNNTQLNSSKMKAPTQKQNRNPSRSTKPQGPQPQPISISQLSQLTISASAGTSSYTSSLLSSICGTPSSIKMNQRSNTCNQLKLNGDQIREEKEFIQVQKQNRNNFYQRNIDNGARQEDIDIMDFQHFEPEEQQSNLLDSTLKSKSNITQNKMHGNIVHKQSLNVSYKQHRYSSIQPIPNLGQRVSSPVASSNKIQTNTIKNTRQTQTQNSHGSSNNRNDHTNLQAHRNLDSNQNAKNVKQFDQGINNNNVCASPSTSASGHKISQSSRQILLQAEIIELQMKCSLLMGIIHKNNYKSAHENNKDFINQSSLSLLNQSQDQVLNQSVNNSINQSVNQSQNHCSPSPSPSHSPCKQTSSKTQSHITQQLQQLSQMQNYINYYKQELQKYQISIDKINRQYMYKIKQLQHQLTQITNKLIRKQQEVELQRKCNAEMVNKNQELILQIEGYKDKIAQYRSKQRQRQKSRQNTISGRNSRNIDRDRDRDIQIDSGIRNSLRRENTRLLRLHTSPQYQHEHSEESMEDTFVYGHNNNRYSPPEDLDISVHTKYSHMYQHPYQHQQHNRSKDHPLIHSPKSPHSPRNTQRHPKAQIIALQQSQSYTMRQYQECLKQMETIITKLMKNLSYQLNNKLKANKEIQRLCSLIKDYQLEIKYKNKCIYQLEKQLIVNEKQKQRNKENYSQDKNNIKDRQIRSSTGSVKCKQNLQKSKQKYQQINRMLTLSKQKQLQKDRQNGKDRQSTRQDNNRYSKQGTQTGRQSIKGRLSESKQRYEQYIKKYRKTKNSEFSPSPSNNTSNSNQNSNTKAPVHYTTQQQTGSIKNNPNVQYNIYTNKQQAKRIERTTYKQELNSNVYNDYYENMYNSVSSNNANNQGHGYNLNRPRPTQNCNVNSKFYEDTNGNNGNNGGAHDGGKNTMVKSKNIGEYVSKDKDRDRDNLNARMK